MHQHKYAIEIAEESALAAGARVSNLLLMITISSHLRAKMMYGDLKVISGEYA